MIKEWIRKHISDYTDQWGEIVTIDLIEDLQKEFGLPGGRAEEYVSEALDEYQEESNKAFRALGGEMNTITIEFTGTVKDLIALLKKQKAEDNCEGTVRIAYNQVADKREAERKLISELVECDGYIAAIKLCRERTGMGLKEAKDFVDTKIPRERFPNAL